MRTLVLALALLLLVPWATPSTAGDPPVPHPGPHDRCPVCGMFVAKYTNWIAAVTIEGDGLRYFDGPKDMFRYLLEPGRYETGRTASDIAGAYVTEYYSTEFSDAHGLFFVRGSDVLGPMGNELVPVRGEDAAETFRKDHGGEAVYTFPEVTLEVLRSLQ